MKRIQYPKDDNYIKEYSAIFSDEIEQMEKQWEKILHDNALLNDLAEDTVADILTYKYSNLVDVYNKYVSATNGIKEEDKKKLKGSLVEVFDYSKWSGKIADYFMDHSKNFNITTCYYCETAYINTYIFKKRNKRHFDLDHVIPQAKCPIVSLSLFNFVPSCTVCNQRLKKKSILGRGGIPSIVLSPSSSEFDVDTNSTFEIHIKEKVDDSSIDRIKPTDHPEDYEVVINTHGSKDDEYFIKKFRINERYEFHKIFALHWLEMKKKYNGTSLEMMSKLFEDTSFSAEHIRADIFQYDLDKEGKRCFSKLKKDILAE